MVSVRKNATAEENTIQKQSLVLSFQISEVFFIYSKRLQIGLGWVEI